MKITKRRLRQIIKEEYHRVVREDREELKDVLDHVDPADVVHATHDTWEGGEVSSRKGDDPAGPPQGNLVMPVDHSAAGGSEKVTRSPETLDITGISETILRRILARLS